MEKLGIGSIVKMKDNEEDFGDAAGQTKTVTGHVDYRPKIQGYRLDNQKNGIYIEEDFSEIITRK